MLSLVATAAGQIVFAAQNLPLPPVGVNHQYGLNPFKRRKKYLAPELARYRERELQPMVNHVWARIGPFHQAALVSAHERHADLQVIVNWRLPNRDLYRRDLDGLGKYPLDCLCGFLDLNDARIVELHQTKSLADTKAREGFDITIVALHDTTRKGRSA